MTFPPDLPDEITVQAGRSVDLELPSYAGSGYSWTVESPGGTDIATAVLGALGNDPASPPPQEPGVTEPPTVTLVPGRLTITGISPGTTHCYLTLRRSFASGPPAARYDLQITVLP